MKQFTTVVTAAVLVTAISTTTTAAEGEPFGESCPAQPVRQEEKIRETVRQKLCESLKNGVLSGNLSPSDAASRLAAYDKAGK